LIVAPRQTIPLTALHDHHNAAIMPMPRHHASHRDRRAFSSRSPRYTDPFMLHLYAALAEKERALISTRTKAALAAKKAAGATLAIRESARRQGNGRMEYHR
jgi:hypothetical protein